MTADHCPQGPAHALRRYACFYPGRCAEDVRRATAAALQQGDLGAFLEDEPDCRDPAPG